MCVGMADINLMNSFKNKNIPEPDVSRESAPIPQFIKRARPKCQEKHQNLFNFNKKRTNMNCVGKCGRKY